MIPILYVKMVVSPNIQKFNGCLGFQEVVFHGQEQLLSQAIHLPDERKTPVKIGPWAIVNQHGPMMTTESLKRTLSPEILFKMNPFIIQNVFTLIQGGHLPVISRIIVIPISSFFLTAATRLCHSKSGKKNM